MVGILWPMLSVWQIVSIPSAHQDTVTILYQENSLQIFFIICVAYILGLRGHTIHKEGSCNRSLLPI